MLEQGPTEKRIIEQAMRAGGRLPESIKNAPKLHIGLEIFLTAFLDLTGSRPLGMSPGPIPWVVINDYCVRMQFTDDQADDVHYHVNAMDTVWLKWHQSKEK